MREFFKVIFFACVGMLLAFVCNVAFYEAAADSYSAPINPVNVLPAPPGTFQVYFHHKLHYTVENGKRTTGWVLGIVDTRTGKAYLHHLKDGETEILCRDARNIR